MWLATLTDTTRAKEQRSDEFKEYSHKWMISVESPSYVRVKTVIQSEQFLFYLCVGPRHYYFPE